MGRTPQHWFGSCVAIGAGTQLCLGGQWGRGSSQFPHGSSNKCFLPDATTAFVGQCFVDAGGKETLSTTWLLREAVGSLEEDWKATR